MAETLALEPKEKKSVGFKKEPPKPIGRSKVQKASDMGYKIGSKEAEKVLDSFKTYHEKQDFYTKNATMQDVRALAKLYEKVGNDVRKFNEIEKNDLEKILIDTHLETHGELLKREHGFDYKHIESLPDDKKIAIINTLFDVDLNIYRDTIFREGSDTNFNQLHQYNIQRKNNAKDKSISHHFSKLDEKEQLQLIKEKLLPAVGKGYEFNDGLLKANPETIGQVLADVYSGTDAKIAVRPLTYKSKVKDTYKGKKAA